MSILADIRTLAGLRPAAWLDLVRATFALAKARHSLGSTTARTLLSTEPRDISPQVLTDEQAAVVARVAYAIPRMGARVPWRSDCLVQALAAKRWLEHSGISSSLRIGVRKEAQFDAHAWLIAGETIVTGGDISSYTPFVAPSNEGLEL